MVSTPEELKAKFLLRDDVHFLNHGSFGACPGPVFAEYQRLQRKLEAEPVDFLHSERDLTRRLAETRATMANFIGCNRDEMVFVPNATTGLNIVARSLKLKAGDEVLSCDHEYGALDRTWRFLCEKAGAHYIRRHIPLPLDDPQDVVEAIWNGVTEKTRVLFLSHITSPTGVILPVEDLVRRARERDILTILDSAHVPGQIPLNLHDLGCDFASGNFHKWLLAPKGSAFLYARDEVQELLEPLIVSWGWEAMVPGPSRFVDEQEWTGTRDPSAWLATPSALKFMQENQWPEVALDCRQRLLETRERVLAHSGLEPLARGGHWLAQMATLPLPDGDAKAMGHRLRHEFRVEAPVFDFGGRNWVRVSVQGYNTQADLDAFVAAVAQLGT